jgi:hypothetical protein
MNPKTIISLLAAPVTALLLLAAPAAVQAHAQSLTYTTNDGTITITGCPGDLTEPGTVPAVTIPTNINGLPVTGIGNGAFSESSIQAITIPDGVTSIGESAFYYCIYLASITIPDGVTSIGDFAFNGCVALTSIAIPASVTNIGQDMFYNCTSLTAITVDTNNSFYRSVNGVLFNKNQTVLLQYPNGINGGYTIPDSVSSIGEYAFAGSSLSTVCGCGLTSVVIPSSVTSIGLEAFWNCKSLSSVIVGSGVTSLGVGAFGYCGSLTGIYFVGNAPVADLMGEPMFLSDNLVAYYLPGSTGWSSTFADIPAVLWNPVIQAGDASFGVRNNQFGFNITGTTSIPIVVETCTDLTSSVWSPVQTLTLTNGKVYFSEPVQTNISSRYYRADFP